MGAIASSLTTPVADDSSYDAYINKRMRASYTFSHIRTINPCDTTREWQYFRDPAAPYEKDPLHPKNPYVYDSLSFSCEEVYSSHPPKDKDDKKRMYTGKEIGIGADAIITSRRSYYPPMPPPLE